jgi:hypothetical protein
LNRPDSGLFSRKGKARNGHFGLWDERSTTGSGDKQDRKPRLGPRPSHFHCIAASGGLQGRMLFLVCVTCRFCQAAFCVCRSCYRRQAYCGAGCRRAARLCSHREAQRRYRQTEKGRRLHCLAENRRRHGKNRAGLKKMADQSSKPGAVRCKRGPAKQAIGVSFRPGGLGYCRFCTRWGVVVSKFARRGYGKGVHVGLAG